MTLLEFADIIGKNIEIRYVPGRKEIESGEPAPFYCHFEKASVKDGVFLRSNFGNGKSPEEAMRNYCADIRGQCLVFDGYQNRQEYNVPDTLGK